MQIPPRGPHDRSTPSTQESIVLAELPVRVKHAALHVRACLSGVLPAVVTEARRAYKPRTTNAIAATIKMLYQTMSVSLPRAPEIVALHRQPGSLVKGEVPTKAHAACRCPCSRPPRTPCPRWASTMRGQVYVESVMTRSPLSLRASSGEPPSRRLLSPRKLPRGGAQTSRGGLGMSASRGPTVFCMARMTPKEATAVNVLLGYLAGKEDQPPREVVLGLGDTCQPRPQPSPGRLVGDLGS